MYYIFYFKYLALDTNYWVNASGPINLCLWKRQRLDMQNSVKPLGGVLKDFHPHVRMTTGKDSKALTCPQHHRWITGVCAASNGSDDHRTMSKGEFTVIIDKRLLVIMMVQSNLEAFKPLL